MVADGGDGGVGFSFDSGHYMVVVVTVTRLVVGGTEKGWEIGYCQGMSDLLSPIILVMEKDHKAFWCFVGFMKKGVLTSMMEKPQW
ncbi:hypothetical protein LIER_29654 [Lithospermum erythrorhizon]|uniref:Rab-GAP TBC domain-containing protein n=1 Tax=Lithospermum erythrorhizon TaxID=34254 RepID=A0AAV3RNI6_LITER